eukprot:1629076-Pleurochrysis_carterae.AAC.1
MSSGYAFAEQGVIRRPQHEGSRVSAKSAARRSKRLSGSRLTWNIMGDKIGCSGACHEPQWAGRGEDRRAVVRMDGRRERAPSGAYAPSSGVRFVRCMRFVIRTVSSNADGFVRMRAAHTASARLRRASRCSQMRSASSSLSTCAGSGPAGAMPIASLASLTAPAIGSVGESESACFTSDTFSAIESVGLLCLATGACECAARACGCCGPCWGLRCKGAVWCPCGASAPC